mmetsp:Transcript_39485/g.119333  ORF Transcript_39485/g.119333 Transcript_39485/m.119333 type:complete len:223 (+) Transcript_39485:391-1059(+)
MASRGQPCVLLHALQSTVFGYRRLDRLAQGIALRTGPPRCTLHARRAQPFWQHLLQGLVRLRSISGLFRSQGDQNRNRTCEVPFVPLGFDGADHGIGFLCRVVPLRKHRCGGHQVGRRFDVRPWVSASNRGKLHSFLTNDPGTLVLECRWCSLQRRLVRDHAFRRHLQQEYPRERDRFWLDVRRSHLGRGGRPLVADPREGRGEATAPGLHGLPAGCPVHGA